MANDTLLANTSSAEERAIEALAKILESASSPDLVEVQRLILRRLALSGDVFPSRVPPPLNITQVGGYLNLLEKQPEFRSQVIAAALGVAGPNLNAALEPTQPTLFFATRRNDRPAGTSQSSFAVSFSIRSDFADAFDQALAEIHSMGCQLPIHSPIRALPRAIPGSQASADPLECLGRMLELAPTAGLVDPSIDALALGSVDGGALEVVSRVLDPTAVKANLVDKRNWSLWKCTPTSSFKVLIEGAYLSLGPILNSAGWYQQIPAPPANLLDPGGWSRYMNLTGLIPGRTRLRDELSFLYTPGAIAQSALRDHLDWTWNGVGFSASE